MTSSGNAHLYLQRYDMHVVNSYPIDVAENLGQVHCTECTGQENESELIPAVKMEARYHAYAR